MKKILTLTFVALAAAVACKKNITAGATAVRDSAEPVEMVFAAQGEGLDMEVTKAAAVTSVSTVYWSATTGTIGSDTEKYAPMSITLADSKFSTGYYWPSTETTYNYYVSNTQFTWTADTHAAEITVADNSVDVVAGKAASVAYESAPEIVLDHIFARSGSLTLEAKEGYELLSTPAPVWEIQSNTGAGTAGKYNIGTGAWTASAALAKQAFTSSSDLYVLPGSYHVEITYTLKKGDFVKEFTKGADVTFVAGKTNNIKATAHVGDDVPEEIVFSVTVTPWDDNDITIPEKDLN